MLEQAKAEEPEIRLRRLREQLIQELTLVRQERLQVDPRLDYHVYLQSLAVLHRKELSAEYLLSLINQDGSDLNDLGAEHPTWDEQED